MKRFLFFLVVILVMQVSAASAGVGWSYNPTVSHVPQPNDHTCGTATMAMWIGYIYKMSIDVDDVAATYYSDDGTKPEELLQVMFDWTPYGYVFSQWEYSDPQAAVKGLMWSIARFNQPVAIVGLESGPGHYILVRGGSASYNPYTNYSESNHIWGVYVNDPTEGSPAYSYPVSKMFRKQPYAPKVLMDFWKKRGAYGDKKYRSFERECYACWSLQGKTQENNYVFTDY